MKLLLLLQALLIITLLSSCGGYQFRKDANPFIDYGIKSISVPTFYNRSIISDFTPALTREFILMLNTYPGLTVYSGNNEDADAVLIGVLYSPSHRGKFFTQTQDLLLQGKLKDSIGEREKFTVPYKLKYDMTLAVYLIKRPTKDELNLIKEHADVLINASMSKVVMAKSIPISSSIARVNYSNLSADEGGVVNHTQNKAILHKSMDDHAASTASYFKELVINAF